MEASYGRSGEGKPVVLFYPGALGSVKLGRLCAACDAAVQKAAYSSIYARLITFMLLVSSFRKIEVSMSCN
jgi:hypothetical protein